MTWIDFTATTIAYLGAAFMAVFLVASFVGVFLWNSEVRKRSFEAPKEMFFCGFMAVAAMSVLIWATYRSDQSPAKQANEEPKPIAQLQKDNSQRSIGEELQRQVILQRNPINPVLEEIARKLENEGRVLEAVAILEEVIRRYKSPIDDPNQTHGVHASLAPSVKIHARLLTKLGRHDAAVKSWEDLFEFAGKTEYWRKILREFSYEYACCLQRAKQWQKAIAEFEQMLPADYGEKEFEPHLRLAEVYEAADPPLRDLQKAAKYRSIDKRQKDEMKEPLRTLDQRFPGISDPWWIRLQNTPGVLPGPQPRVPNN